jgi:hypothetical protein
LAVGDPTELDPWLVYSRLSDAIERGTSLRASVHLLGDRSAPTPLLHRHFRLNPERVDFTPPSRARPGDVVLLTERVVVVLSHDRDPNQAQASYQLAAQDWIALLRAVLTRTEISGLAQPLGGGLVRRIVGSVIEQQLALNLQYHVTLPEAV